jgi:hypothetical protein
LLSLRRELLLSFGSFVSKVIREGPSGEGVPTGGSSDHIFIFLLHASECSDVELYFLFLGIKLIDIDLDVLDFIFVFFELSVGLVLSVEMGEHLVIDPEFEGLPLLDDVECKAIESEGVLEGDVGREFIFEQYFSVNRYFDLSRDEGEVENDGMVLILERDVPCVSLLASRHVLTDLFDLKSEGLNLLHLN